MHARILFVSVARENKSCEFKNAKKLLLHRKKSLNVVYSVGKERVYVYHSSALLQQLLLCKAQ